MKNDHNNIGRLGKKGEADVEKGRQIRAEI